MRLADLAALPDRRFGTMTVSPSRRLLEGPGGQASLEPIVMRVFVKLLDAEGKVVTRGELFDECWGGVYVSDDSLNRAIVNIRRAGSKVAPGLFQIETIPRTGYRLIFELAMEQAVASEPSPSPARISRRGLVTGGAALAVLGGSAGLLAWRSRSNPDFDGFMKSGEEALRLDRPGARYFERAVAVEPDSARAWGLLAYALASGAEDGPRGISAADAQAADRAARRALAIDPGQTDARLAKTILESDLLDWFTREERYRALLASDPGNVRVILHLGQMLHSVGRCRDALSAAERAIAIEPLSPELQFRKALRLWVVGDVVHSDQVINRALELWPAHPLIRMARVMVYGFTGRAPAALTLIEQEESRPTFLTPAAASIWRASIEALGNPTPSAIARARNATIEGSKSTPAVAAWSILTLSALGQVDSAFDVANGFLLGRGSVIVRPRVDGAAIRLNSPGWRNTFGLFTPPTAAMRLDPRFASLANGLGLTEYWRRRGIGPDRFLFDPGGQA